MPSASMDQNLIEPIAIIGLSFKFPQNATSSDAFWKMLTERECAMTEWPADRLNIDAFQHPNKTKGTTLYSRGGNFMKESLAAFDASFFSITADEAKAMDPQHRLLLETSYRALENGKLSSSGIPLEKAFGSKTGVYTGSMADDYRFTSLKDVDDIPRYSVTGLAMSLLANRVSWFFNFGGPSINLDSACSSSLMALDIACQGLRNGDSSMALVAGSSLIDTLETWITLSKMDFLSPTSRCYSFDSRANGYARGEGIGVVVIKRLSDAIRDNDTIRAVIRSTGSNSDGHTPGITQPSRQAQSQLIMDTYGKAGLDPSITRYFEAHGTGTPIGDPLEAAAIGSVFRQYRNPADPLYIGALKSNIGHLEGGSGIAGLIKAVLVLEKGIIPPNANFEEINPNIDTKFLNIKFPTKPVPWPCKGLRRASVNSFGFGGSNSHCILDDTYHFLELHSLYSKQNVALIPHGQPELIEFHANGGIGSLNDHTNDIKTITSEPKTMHRQPRLLLWSAADKYGLLRLAKAYSLHGENLRPKANTDYLENLAYTLAFRRSSLPWRSFIVTSDIFALTKLQKLISLPTRISTNRGIAFVFTGQGAQYSQMGVTLFSFPEFKTTLREIDGIFKKLGCSWSLFDELRSDSKTSNIDNPDYSQPLCTALQIGLVELFRSFGIFPSVVIGHSSGEIAAAYVVGGLSLESACKVAYFRGKVAAKLRNILRDTPGAMISVNLRKEEVHQYLSKVPGLLEPEKITVACVNSQHNVTLSGSEVDIDIIQRQLDDDGIFGRKLVTGLAYHSPQMELVSVEYSAAISNLEKGHSPRTPVSMISSVTGERVLEIDDICQSRYWVENMIRPVLFEKAYNHLADLNKAKPKKRLGTPMDAHMIQDIIEIGPHPALQRAIKSMGKSSQSKTEIRYHASLNRSLPSVISALELAGRLHSLGYSLRLNHVNQISLDDTKDRQTLTDLPEYPFNHDRLFWHEPRVQKEFRHRQHPSLDLLGTSMIDRNPLDARWRKLFDSSQASWVQDHKVNGKVIYPAAGMIVMAIEAAKQLASKDRVIKGFKFRDTTISNPIPVADHGDRTETQLYMRPLQNAFDKDCPASEFRIYVVNNSKWKEVGRGTVQVEYDSPLPEVDWGHAEDAYHEDLRSTFQQAVKECTQVVGEDKLYQCFRDLGLDLGPSFQALKNISYNGDNVAVADVKTFDWASQEGPDAVQPHTIHPTTLDAAVQLSWVSLTKGCTIPIPTTIPTHIHSAWISNSGLGYPEVSTLRAYCTASFKGTQKAEISSFALDRLGNVRLVISQLESSMVSSNEQLPEDLRARQLCYYLTQKPDIEYLRRADAFHICRSVQDIENQKLQFYLALDALSRYYASKVLIEISKRGNELCNAKMKPYLRKYLDSLEYYLKANSAAAKEQSEIDVLINSVQEDPVGRAHVVVGKNLQGILEGIVDPLELLFSEDNLAESYYYDICHRGRYCKDITRYLDLLAHKNPSMNILEVGAGKGSFTDCVFPTLLRHEESEKCTERFSSYDYTDISNSFFEQGRKKFGSLTDRINFKLLNIEEDLLSQGFKDGTFDLIFAHCVLHATSRLASTLQNCRRLLKPGGKLIILEMVRPDLLRTGFVFGILEGWWLSTEKNRPWSPCVTEDTWNKVLTESEFSGVDLSFHDYEDARCHEFSILVSTAIEQNEVVTSLDRLVIVADLDSSLQQEVFRSIKDHLNLSISTEVEIVSIENVVSVQNHETAFFVFLLELESKFLYDLSEPNFEILRKILLVAEKSIWATYSPKIMESSPKHGMIDGLARVIRSETNNTLVTVHFEDPSTNSILWGKTIAEILWQKIEGTNAGEEVEYTQRDGTLLINRVVEARTLDQKIHNYIHPQMKNISIEEAGAVSLTVEKPGLLDSLCFAPDKQYSEQLGLDEVEIKVQYLGLNFRDLLVTLGRHAANGNSLGCECSGVVTRVGSNCTSFSPGDKACIAKIGCMNTFVRSHSDLVFKIPSELSTAQAAGTLITGSTVYYALVEIARLKKGETLLIHSASGATGQMAVQFAKYLKCEVFVTVGNDKKKELMMNRYDIPEDHIFYSRNLSFATGIMRKTQGRGVDVVLNSLSGDALVATWELIAPYGRFIELGKVDIHGNSKLPMSSFGKNVSFTAVAIDRLMFERPKVFREITVAVLDLLQQQYLKPVYPFHIIPIANVQEGMRLLQSGKMSGKVVFSVEGKDIVPTIYQYKSKWSFDSSMTYVIAGGLGGLGRSAALWMASKGAKHLILLSRSGPSTPAAQRLLERLHQMGVAVEAPACDVSSPEQLEYVLSECLTRLPPIKGCIQGTMVLQDALFEKMTFQEWSTAISSKVPSTLNLHNLLPKNLEFFILLSSIAGIGGSIGQSNYAAGNTFQDALCLHRLAIGQRATCIRLGIMADIGIVSESDKYFKNIERMVDMASIKETEFLALLDHYCDPKSTNLSPEKNLPIIGLVTPTHLESQGVEVPHWIQSPVFAPLAQIGLSPSSTTEHKSGSTDFAAELRGTSTFIDAQEVVLKALVAKLARALGISSIDVDTSKPLHAYGVDSLLAVELRNWFRKELGANIAVFDIMGAESISVMSATVTTNSSLVVCKDEA